MGQFTLFTYVRPFLEESAHISVSNLSIILLLMGLAGFVGTLLIGNTLKTTVYPTLVTVPLIMMGLAILLIVSGKSVLLVALILTAWGFFSTSAPVGWWTWLARTLPHDAEAGGGLMVAVVQLAITLGATSGGILFDMIGYQATFGASAIILAGATIAAVGTARLSRH